MTASVAATLPDPEAAPAWLADPQAQPVVSIIIPMYNEERHIAACLQAVLDQDYPPGKLEILVVDGASTDRSAATVQELFIANGAPVRLLHNPGRKTPHGLNMGLVAAVGEVIVILGAHAEVRPGFLQLNLENLRRPGVFCSGGTLENGGASRTERSIGETMRHPFAMATATHRYSRRPGPARTAVFGAYRREIFAEVGPFEERGQMAEDAELNWRIVEAGHTIYYDPRIRTAYHPRSTLRALARQLYTYGILRAQLYRKHRRGLSLLHFVPPVAVLTAAALLILSPFGPIFAPALAGLATVYGVLAASSALYLWFRSRRVNPLTILAAFGVIHGSWGIGFLAGLLRPRAEYGQTMNPAQR